MNSIPTRTIKQPPVYDMGNIENNEDEFRKYVEDNIERMRRYSNLGDASSIPGYFMLNEALMNYHSVYCSLIALDVEAKLEWQEAKNELEDWEDKRYLEAKDTLNPPTLAKTKWSSQSEIEHYMRHTWYYEYKALRERVILAENKVSYCRRLLESWDKQQLILNRLCKNVEVEATQLGAGVVGE